MQENDAKFLEKLDNIYILSFLILFYPAIFFLSQNPENFDFIQILVGFIFLLCIYIINTVIDKLHKFFHVGKGLFLIILSSLESLVFLNNLTSGFHENNYHFYIIAPIVLLIILFLYFKRFIRFLSVFFIISVSLSLINFTVINLANLINLYMNKNITNIVFDKNENIYNSIKFIHKPNIYYFYLESYGSKDFLKKEMNIDNSKFYNFLDKNSFYTKDTYSNYTYTILSLYTTMLMDYKYNTDEQIKKFISGTKENNVLNILKNNGYDINYYLNNYYFYLNRKNYITRVNCKYNPFHFIKHLLSKNIQYKLMMVDNEKFKNEQYYYDILVNTIKTNLKQYKTPQFYMIKGIDIHHIPSNKNYLAVQNQKDKNIIKSPTFLFPWWENEYKRKLEIENTYLMKTLNFIIKNDPNSIILLLGDHGPRNYHIFIKSKNIQEKSNVSPEQFANGDFGIIFAIRSPYKNDTSYTNISNVNVFRTIFYDLSKDENILKTIKPDYSIISNRNFSYKITKNGKILNPFEKDKTNQLDGKGILKIFREITGTENNG